MYGMSSPRNINLCWPVSVSMTSEIAYRSFPTAVVFISLYFLGFELDVHLKSFLADDISSTRSSALSQLAILMLLFMAVISV